MREPLLLGPGPSNVSAAVREALARPTIGHLDPEFLALMDELQGGMRDLFRTTNELTIAVSGTGSSGMETLLTNLLEPGDRFVSCVNGVFGGRAAELGRRLGADVEELAFPWGEPVDPDAVRRTLRDRPARALLFVHAETSTGALTDAAAVAAAAREEGALVLMDCVTSLGGLPVEIDAWGVDGAFSGTQKCLSVPPGLAPLTVGPRALDRMDERRGPPPSWYLDLGMVRSYWGPERTYHHTAPVNMVYGLVEALRGISAEGLDQRFGRHLRAHERLVAGLAELGLTLVPPEGARLPMLNAVRVPGDVTDEAAVRRALLDHHDIEIGAGLGALAGKVWRIGLMGENARPAVVDRFLDALRTELDRVRR
jgi:alanine-glyoxylate transaminase/serine-glyoxylate transaminase/serine-pyruvate transaminase